MTDVTYAAPSGQLGGYLTAPDGNGPWPGVIVIMDALGLSEDIRRCADRLAGGGYVAFAPDLYSGRGLRCVLVTLAASRSGSGAAYADIEAAKEWLERREECEGGIGIIGFCMGGGFAVQCAPRYGFAASAPNYGEVPKDASRLAGACPVVGSYGRRDLTLRGRARRLERALTDHGVAHDVKEYPDAGHSFMNQLAGPLPGAALRCVGFDYHEPSAEDAWRRILAFFDTHVPRAG